MAIALLVAVACGSDSTPPTEGRAAQPSAGAVVTSEPQPDAPQAGSACDTAFVFTARRQPNEVIEVVRASNLGPVETRFSTEGAADGTTGGSVGSPGSVGTVDQIASAIEMARELHGAEPLIVGIRVRGDVDANALGALADAVHTRMLVPQAAAVSMTPPDVDPDAPVKVVGGASCGA